MTKDSRFLIILAFIFIFSSQAHASFAKVLLVKGQVSYLGPGMKEPLWVTSGMTFKEDTSIVTRAKSFVKIRILDDGSSISLGPDSKIVVTKVKPDKGSVISLLNGQLRSKVEKSKNLAPNESKLYIKTRTAALGVRGTEFIAIANQENHVTSLITLEGEVAMNKIDTSIPISNIEKTVKEALDTTEQVTLVKKGNTATSYLHKEELTAPVKVNPVQLIALKKNNELTTSPTIKEKDLVQISQGVISEELKKELYAPDSSGKIEDVPTNGGIVDLKSAIFIPEIKNNETKIGNLDANTGEFIPVEGIKLDVKKGFIVAHDTTSPELAQKAKDLNAIVEYKEVPKNFAPGHETFAQVKNNQFSVDHLSHELSSFVGLSEFVFDGNSDKTSTVSALKFGFEYTYTRPWSETINLITSIGGAFIGLDTKDYETDKNKDLENESFGPKLSIGFLYKIQPDILFITKFVYEHELLPVLESNGTFESIGIVSKSAKTTGFDFSSKITYSEKVDLLISYKTRFQDNSNAIKLDATNGYSLTAFYNFMSPSRHKLSLTFDRNFYEYNNQKAYNSNILLGHTYKF